MAQQLTGIPPNILTYLHQQAQTALDVNHPDLIDHHAAHNPYKSKYGDNWLKHLKASSHMSFYVCITDYVEHIMQASFKAMKGNKHEDDWMIYHDALSLKITKT